MIFPVPNYYRIRLLLVLSVKLYKLPWRWYDEISRLGTKSVNGVWRFFVIKCVFLNNKQVKMIFRKNVYRFGVG